jgi:nitronate monooxygenase
MWSRNRLTERLNLKWPIFQAPMGDAASPALAAAVSSSGGLGGLGMWGFSAEDVERRIAGFRQLSGGALNVNYPLWPMPLRDTQAEQPMRQRAQELYAELNVNPIPDQEPSSGAVDQIQLAMLQRMRPEVVSFHFGLPGDDVLRTLKAEGIFIISSATTVAEAKMLEARGVDAVIAQGLEAGGHRGTFSDTDVSMQPGLFALLPQIVDAVSVPVIAAGGIADGRGIAAAIVLGASAVQMGTAFLRCEEANVSDAYRSRLGSATETATVVTPVISGRPARVIRNSLVERLSKDDLKPLPFPTQFNIVDPMAALGDGEYMGIYAGQSVAMTRAMSALQLIQLLAEETTASLSGALRL